MSVEEGPRVLPTDRKMTRTSAVSRDAGGCLDTRIYALNSNHNVGKHSLGLRNRRSLGTARPLDA